MLSFYALKSVFFFPPLSVSLSDGVSIKMIHNEYCGHAAGMHILISFLI